VTYVKLEDTCPDHPSIVGLSDPAFACWVRCLCYASRHLTDGFIPRSALRSLGTAKASRELIGAGRLEETTEGWTVHGYAEKQRTREQVERDRQQWRERSARHRESAPPSRRDEGVSHEGVTLPEVEVEAQVEEEAAAPLPPASTPELRKARLAAAAEIIGDRAAQRSGVRDPVAASRAVARAVVTDRYADAFAILARNPIMAPSDLAEELEPTAPVQRLVLAPTTAPEEIADFKPAAPPRLDPSARAQGLAKVREMRTQPPDPAA
jgi:hypothetical protein